MEAVILQILQIAQKQLEHLDENDRICSDHFEGGISIFELLTPMNTYVKDVVNTRQSAYRLMLALKSYNYK